MYKCVAGDGWGHTASHKLQQHCWASKATDVGAQRQALKTQAPRRTPVQTRRITKFELHKHEVLNTEGPNESNRSLKASPPETIHNACIG